MKNRLRRAKSIEGRAMGFTLIELLIVISIIGVLMTIATVNFIGVRERARDAERKSDIVQLQTALEMYRADVGQYPASLPNCNAQLTNGATPTIVYLRKSPCDPSNPTTVRYTYTPSGNPRLNYTLYACLENENDQDGVAGAACVTGSVQYLVNNP